MAMADNAFIDVDHARCSKHRQSICGDVVLTNRIKEEGRILAVLSDGLGSGVKASVLANLTASMALKFASTCTDTRIWARSIMDTLPICEVRKISYSTFTLIDLDESGSLRFIEHGNPPLVLLRGAEEVELERSVITLERWKDRLIYHGRLNWTSATGCSVSPTASPSRAWAKKPCRWAGPRRRAVDYARELICAKPGHLFPATGGCSDGSGARQ